MAYCALPLVKICNNTFSCRNLTTLVFCPFAPQCWYDDFYEKRDIRWCFVLFRFIKCNVHIRVTSATAVFSSSNLQREQVVVGFLSLLLFSPFIGCFEAVVLCFFIRKTF